jgi:hypothetical protein
MSTVIDVASTRLPDHILQVFVVDASHSIRACWKMSLEPGADWTPWGGFPGSVRRIRGCTRINPSACQGFSDGPL